jgi:hypothetical protein
MTLFALDIPALARKRHGNTFADWRLDSFEPIGRGIAGLLADYHAQWRAGEGPGR